MAFQPVPNAALVRITGHLNGQECVNTQYRFLSGGWTTELLGDLADQYLAWVEAFMMPLVHTNYSLDFIECIDLSVDGGAGVTLAPPTVVNGDKGGLCMPNNVSYCVSFRTGLTGRSNRGRNYIGGISDSDVIAVNQVKDAFRVQVVTAYEELLTGGSVDIGSWCIVSRFHNKVQRPTGVTAIVNSVLTVDNVLDSQRRRLPGRGA